MGAYGNFAIPGFGNLPPPPPPPMLIPHQVNKNAKRAIAQASVQNTYNVFPTSIASQPAVVSAKPTLYTSTAKANMNVATAQPSTAQPTVDFVTLQTEVEKKLKKLKNEKVSAELAISQGI